MIANLNLRFFRNNVYKMEYFFIQSDSYNNMINSINILIKSFNPGIKRPKN